MTQDTEASQDAVENTDDELNRAAEELLEETPEPTEEAEAVEETAETPEELPEEPKDNAERSRMGRTVKTLKEEVAALRDQLASVAPVAPVTAETEEDGEELITRTQAQDETRRIIETMAQEKEVADLQYKSSFVQRVVDMGEGEEHESILEEMLTNHNTQITGNPDTDAQLNYNAAAATYYKGLAGVAPTRQNPVTGQAPSGALGVSRTATIPKKSVAMPKLSPLEQDFVDSQGMSAEQVKRALG